MSTRTERITVEIEIPDGDPIAGTISEVMGEMEDGIQRTGLAYRWAEDDGRWPELKKYLEAFENLKKLPTPHASVTAIRAETITIQTGGRALEVERPKDLEGRYLELMIRIEKGENIEVFLQPKFELQPKFRKNGVLYRPIAYIADFKIVHGDGRIEIEDVKGWGGYTTDIYKIKKKLFEYKYPELSLIALKKKGSLKDIERLKIERQELKDNSTQRTKT